MEIRLRMRHKILALVLSISALTYLIAIGYIASSTRKDLIESSYSKIHLSVAAPVARIQTRFESYMSVSYTLAEAFSNFQKMPADEWQPLFLEMEKKVYRELPELFSLWDSYEFKSFHADYVRPHGALQRHLYFTSNGEIECDEHEAHMTSEPPAYTAFKKQNRAYIWEPYRSEKGPYADSKRLLTTIAAPIRQEGQFAGLVGCNVELSWLQALVKGINPFKGSSAFALSHEGIIVAHPQDTLLLHPIGAFFTNCSELDQLKTSVKMGREFSFVYADTQGESFYVYLAPIRVSKSSTNWSLGVSVPIAAITAVADSHVRTGVLIGFIAMLLLTIVSLWFSFSLSRPLELIRESLRRLGRGEIRDDLQLNIRRFDEIGFIGQAYDELLDGLRTKEQFARNLSDGNYTQDPPFESEMDALGASLLSIRNRLRTAKTEREEREAEDARREWVSTGISEFSELLRQHMESVESLSDTLLARLVRYFDAELGALYLLDDAMLQWHTEAEYVVKATFAWGRKRYLENRFPLGIGLVGACAMEREQTFITDVPCDYSRIIAGVGDALPNCIALQPLLYEGNAIGVVEIASFRIFEPHELEFLQTISDSIASSLYNAQVGALRQALLERARKRVAELTSVEEGLKDKVLEQQGLLEELEREKGGFQSLFSALTTMLYFMEFDRDGYVIDVNQRYLTRVQRPRDLVLNTYFSDNLTVQGWAKREYDEFWKKLLQGEPQQLEVMLTVDMQEFLVREYYVPIRSASGDVERVVRVSLEL